MDRNDHEHLSGLFRRAAELRGDARRAFLNALDPAVRAELESLLEYDESRDELLAAGGGRALLESAPGEVPVPEQIGSYRVLDVIGRGGMGVVYRAEQESPHRVVALKVIRPEILDQATQRRFAYEVEVLGRLQHPGIAQVYEAGTADTAAGRQPYFAMELVEGLSLLEYVRRHRPGVRDRLELFLKVCDAVHHAHQKGVVHRDVKPGNILVDASGQPKILDFGVARATASDAQVTMPDSDLGRIIGTLAYMSPEQVEGDARAADIRADVYSLGVVLYELLTESLPYSVSDRMLHDAARVIREQPPTPPSAVLRSLRGDVDTIVGKALEKDRKRRYQSASDLAADIQRHLVHEPIVARPASTPYQLWKFTQRHRALVVGVAAAFVALAVGLVLALRAERRSREQLAETRRFADTILLGDLEQERAELWPRRAERIPAYDHWIRRARQLLEQRGDHQRSLQRVVQELVEDQRRSGILGPGDREPDWSRATAHQRFRYQTFRQLVEELEEFPSRIAEMEGRRHIAGELQELTVTRFREEWDTAVDEIFLMEEYGGLELEPQVGLVPLDQDPETGLWEFWHYESGARPQRGEDGLLAMDGDCGIALVLIPGGEIWIGSQAEDPHGRNYDPERRPDEHLARVDLAPYLLSKYEMTVGQWERMTGAVPVPDPTSGPSGELENAPQYPVVFASWRECREALRRHGLCLPTEAQWEHAARAGTDTAWWCGADRDSLRFAHTANLADLTGLSVGLDPDRELLPWSDGYVRRAPVGLFTPNPFGLHDVYGNVWELCLDRYSSAEYPMRDGDGLRLVPEDQGDYHVRRGGGFSSSAEAARSANRFRSPPGNRTGFIGLRPAMAIQP